MPEETTQILLIRHGETEHNVAGLIQGQTDSLLTPLGRSQANLLAAKVSDLKVDALYASPLTRAVDTAIILGASLGLKPTIDGRLAETSFGEVEGKTWSEIAEEFGKESAAWYHHEKDACFPGGETRGEAKERSMAFLKEVAEKYRGGRVAAVTHGGILSGLFAHILKIPDGIRPRCQILNTSLNIVLYKKGRFNIQTWGDISHLNGL